jgi:hypothetical protein
VEQFLMEDYYTHRNQGHRYAIQKIDDSKEIQLVDGNGMADEVHTELMRVYPHGFSSHSIKDAHMLALGLGGRRDLLVALGGEHHEKRPKNIPEGDTVLYNAEGDVIRIFGKKTIDITHSKNIKLSIGQGLKDSGGSGKGKEAEAGQDKKTTVVLTEDDITLTVGDSKIKITKTDILIEAASDIAVGTKGGLYVRVRPGRVDLGISDPKGQATPAVETTAGPSTKVFAVV